MIAAHRGVRGERGGCWGDSATVPEPPEGAQGPRQVVHAVHRVGTLPAAATTAAPPPPPPLAASANAGQRRPQPDHGAVHGHGHHGHGHAQEAKPRVLTRVLARLLQDGRVPRLTIAVLGGLRPGRRRRCRWRRARAFVLVLVRRVPGPQPEYALLGCGAWRAVTCSTARAGLSRVLILIPGEV